MTDKESVYNSFKLIADRIDEDWDILTNKQVGELRVASQAVWAILCRRDKDRRTRT